MYDEAVEQMLPGLLSELCGVQVVEYVSKPIDLDSELEFTELSSRPRASAQAWCDILKPVGAQVIARYTQDFFAGKPAVTLNKVGNGWVNYVGSMGEDLYAQMADYWLEMAGIRPLLPVSDSMEVTERWQGNQRLLFILNHTEQEKNNFPGQTISGTAQRQAVRRQSDNQTTRRFDSYLIKGAIP